MPAWKNEAGAAGRKQQARRHAQRPLEKPFDRDRQQDDAGNGSRRSEDDLKRCADQKQFRPVNEGKRNYECDDR